MINRHLVTMLFSATLLIQGAPAQPTNIPVVELSPFTVSAELDRGYAAATAYTATRVGVPIIDTPLSIQVVTRDFLDDLGIKSFQDSLRYTSGVSADSLNFEGGSIAAPNASRETIRGFVPSMVLQNGFRRNGNLAVDNADRLEIVKGPASVYFGQAAPGGLVNIVTRKPLSKRQATLGYVVGSYDYHKVNVDLTGPLHPIPKVDYRLFASWQDSKDWKDFAYIDRIQVSPSLTWRPHQNLAVTASYDWVERRSNDIIYTTFGAPQYFADYATPPADVLSRLGITAAQARTRWRGSIARWVDDVAAVRGEANRPYRVTSYIENMSPTRGTRWNSGGPDQFVDRNTRDFQIDATYTLNANVGFRYGLDQFRQTYETLRSAFAIPNGDRTINLVPVYNQAQDEWSIHQFDMLVQNDWKLLRSRVVAGFQYSRNKSVNYNGVLNVAGAPGGTEAIQFYNPATMPPPQLSTIPRTVSPPTSSNRNRNYTRGYSLSWHGYWFDNRVTTLFGARREEDIRHRVGLPVLPDLVRDATVPTAGIVFKPVSDVAFFASYSENFNPNSVRSATGPGLLPSDNASDLPVESGKGSDLGIKVDSRDRRMSGTLTLFQVERTNLPRSDTAREMADPRNALGLAQATSVRFNVAGGAERTRGLELDFLYQPTPSYQMLLAASWMWEAEVVADPSLIPGTYQYDRTFRSGRRLANAPEYLASFWNKYDFSTGPLAGAFIGAGARYSSETEPRANDLTTLLHNPSFVVLDATLGYRTRLLNQAVSFVLSVENLLDRKYYQGSVGVSDPRKVFLRTQVRF